MWLYLKSSNMRKSVAGNDVIQLTCNLAVKQCRLDFSLDTFLKKMQGLEHKQSKTRAFETKVLSFFFHEIDSEKAWLFLSGRVFCTLQHRVWSSGVSSTILFMSGSTTFSNSITESDNEGGKEAHGQKARNVHQRTVPILWKSRKLSDGHYARQVLQWYIIWENCFFSRDPWE